MCSEKVIAELPEDEQSRHERDNRNQEHNFIRVEPSGAFPSSRMLRSERTSAATGLNS